MSKRYVYAVYHHGKPAIHQKGEKYKFDTFEEANHNRFAYTSGHCHVDETSIKKEVARGRPKGANSFALVRMSDLENYLGPDAVIKVSKVWLQEIGLTVDEAELATLPSVVEDEIPEKSEDSIEFSLTTFED